MLLERMVDRLSGNNSAEVTSFEAKRISLSVSIDRREHSRNQSAFSPSPTELYTLRHLQNKRHQARHLAAVQRQIPSARTALLNEETDADADAATPTQPAANMATHQHLYGSCACERNQYAIAIPHSLIQDPSATAAASNLATVFFDNSRANRKSRSILF